MSANDVARALELLQDDALAAAVVGGDLSGLPSGLTGPERDLVVAAAGDRPEVEGFALNAYLPNLVVSSPRTPWNEAAAYATGKDPWSPDHKIVGSAGVPDI